MMKLADTTTPGQLNLEVMTIKWLFYIPQSFRTGASSQDAV